MIKKICRSTYLRLFMAITLFVTSGIEVYESFLDVGSHHGIFIFATFTILQALTDLFEAVEYLDEK